MGGGGGGSGGSKKKKAPPPPPLPTPVAAEQVVEVWRGGQVAFGNFEGRPDAGKGSVRVRLEHGESVAVDAGQLTGVWAPGAGGHGSGGFLGSVEEGDAPATPEGWAALRLRAGATMRGLTPRALELEAFWSLATQRWKRAKLPVDSGHLAAFLFSRKEYERALKAEAQAAARARQEASEAEEEGGEATVAAPVAVAAAPLRLPPVTPAQRYAAAVLLASESFRFKRCVPALAGGAGAAAAVAVVGQGYRPLETSVVHSREVLGFAQAVKSMEERRKLMLAAAVAVEGEGGEGEGGVGGGAGAPSQGQWDAAHWRMLHHLEVRGCVCLLWTGGCVG